MLRSNQFRYLEKHNIDIELVKKCIEEEDINPLVGPVIPGVIQDKTGSYKFDLERIQGGSYQAKYYYPGFSEAGESSDAFLVIQTARSFENLVFNLLSWLIIRKHI